MIFLFRNLFLFLCLVASPAFAQTGAVDKSSFPLKEHPDVVWELAQERFKSAERYDRAYARLKLQNLADQGDRRAALELARRHRDGDGLPQKSICALYWYLRAEQIGADDEVTNSVRELAQKVAPEEQKKIGFALKSKTYRLSEVCDP